MSTEEILENEGPEEEKEETEEEKEEPKKPYKPGFGWKAYCIFAIFLVYLWGMNAFDRDSMVFSFYLIMMAFHKPFAVFYYANVISVILNVASLIPLWCFVFRIRFLKPIIWKWLFVIRLVFDLCGHYYEFVFLKTLYYDDPLFAGKILLAGFLVIVPSYIACYYYAFKQDKVFPPEQLKFT